MSKKFFDSWQLWEKMTFVLACGIVGVILLGCLKLVYNHWRLRKYTALAAAKAAQRQDMQHTPSVRRRKGPDVPFGIRAIESGVEVDGVWISRSNTPAPSVPDSPLSNASVAPSPSRPAHSPDRTSSSSNISRLEIPQPVHGYPGVITSRGGPSSANVPFERGLSTERSPSRPSPSSMASDYVPRGRPTYQPRRSSHLRFSNSQDVDNSAAMAALEGRLLTQKRNVSDESYENPKDQGVARSWSGSSDSDENYSPPKTREHELRSLRPVATARLNSASSQIATANNERILNTPASSGPSKSAHGHGVPQIRLSGVDNDWTPGTQPIEHKYYFAGPPSPLYEDRNDPFDMPADTPRDERTGLNSSSEIRSRDPPNPRFSLSDADEDEISPATRNSQMTQDDMRHLRISQVVRKVNSGFEILRPGTLVKPPQSDDANPGQDLEIAGGSPTKKLHKRTRDSLSLRESRFTEGA